MSNSQSTPDTSHYHLDQFISSEYRKIIVQSLKSFLYAYSLKSILAALSNLKKIKKNPLFFLQLLFQKQQLQSGLFLGSYCLVMKIVNKILNRLHNHPSFNSFLSGFMGGFVSMQFLNKDYRAVFGLYTITRSIDMIYQAYIKDRYFKQFKQDKTIILSCLLFFMGYFFAHEPGVMPKSIVNFYVVMAKEHENDRILHQLWVHKTNNELMKKGIAPHDPFQVLYAKKK